MRRKLIVLAIMAFNLNVVAQKRTLKIEISTSLLFNSLNKYVEVKKEMDISNDSLKKVLSHFNKEIFVPKSIVPFFIELGVENKIVWKGDTLKLNDSNFLKFEVPEQYYGSEKYKMSFDYVGDEYHGMFNTGGKMGALSYTGNYNIYKTTEYTLSDLTPFDYLIQSKPPNAKIYYMDIFSWEGNKSILNKIFANGNSMTIDLDLRKDKSEILSLLNADFEKGNGQPTNTKIQVYQTTYKVLIVWKNKLLLQEILPIRKAPLQSFTFYPRK